VIVSGFITRTAQSTSGELKPLNRVTRSEEIPPPVGQIYSLEFQGDGGAVLQGYGFALIFAGDGPETPSLMPFAFTLRWPDGTTRVLLKYGEQVLAQRAASAQPPRVQVLAPNDGKSWSGSETVRCSASDPDRDALTFREAGSLPETRFLKAIYASSMCCVRLVTMCSVCCTSSHASPRASSPPSSTRCGARLSPWMTHSQRVYDGP